MEESDSTSWTVIRGAAAGEPEHRETFARVYLPVVRSYLRARWNGSGRVTEIEDALQDVFVQCLRPQGALERAVDGGIAGFRGYLFGVVRNVARGHEKSCARPGTAAMVDELDVSDGDDSRLGREFDRALAEALLGEALRRLFVVAESDGVEALRRVELLRLRTQEGLGIAEIARRWDEDPVRLHHQYARAREEFLRELWATLRDHCAADRPIDEQQLLELLRGAD